jgi:Cro/C1-type HTH DNA-binding domain
MKPRLIVPTLYRLEKGPSYLGLEIIAKLATVLELQPAELLRVPTSRGEGEGCC